MPCSPAQLAANRANALKSTGPRTLEGKAVSRRNSLKHGLTGEGVVLPEGDAEHVARLGEALEVEMGPKNLLALHLVGRVALNMVKMGRCSEHELAAVAHRMRHAAAKFDDARLAEVEHAFSWLAAEPATHARRLRASPEGVDRLLGAFLTLRSELAGADGIRWGWEYCDRLHHLMGERRMDVPVSRARALGDAIGGDFQHLRPADGGERSPVERQRWAGEQLVELIDAEMAKLVATRAGLDLAGLALDRLEAPARAIFDDSKEAVLARKYEAAAERAFYRALKEFREVNVEPPQVDSDEQLGTDLTAESGSSLPEAAGAEAGADEGAAEGPGEVRPAPIDAVSGVEAGASVAPGAFARARGRSKRPASLKRGV